MRIERYPFLLLILCFSIFSLHPALGQEKTYKLDGPIPTDPNIKMGRLANGMRYYIRKNEKPEDRAELRLAVNAGATQEDDNQLGLAHFVEHMAFNGTKNFKKSELVDYLESIGTRFGADLNAYTSFDETVYMLQARTDSMELLNKGLLIMEDWASGVTFDGEEIDKERGVVVSEWRTRLSPDQRMQQEYFPIIYKDSRYASRLPIGDPKIIENADYETVRKFYKDWYRPDLMAIIAVGDFDPSWMEREIIKRFSKITKKENPRKKEKWEVPGHKETLFSIVSDKEAPFTRVQVYFKHKHVKTKTVGDYKASLARTLYNRMLNARLFELGQAGEPPFTFAYSGYGSDVGDLDMYQVFAFVAEGQAPKGLEAVLVETKRALDHGFTDTELERQKAEMLKSAEKAFKERDKTESGRLSMSYVYNYLSNNPLPNPEQRLALYKQLLPAVSLEDINPLAKKWITKENRVVVVTGPQKEEVPLPTEEELLALMEDIDNRTLEPYEDKVDDSPLLEKELKLAPITIKEEKKIEEMGVTELTLGNGVRVVLKPTDFKNDEILVRSFSPGGNSLYPDEDYFSASTAATMVNLGGIGRFPIVELEKKLAGKTVNVGPYISERFEGINGSCSPEDLETLFQLIYLYFTAPRKDETALQSYVNRQKSIYANLLSNPNYYFSEAKNVIKYQDHIRKHLPRVEDLEKISLDKAIEIYEDRFKDASDFTFVFVGAFDVEAIKPYLKLYLNNLPKTNREETFKDTKVRVVEGVVDSIIVRGQAPKSLVDITYHGDFVYDTQHRYDYNSLIALLRIKLREALREDKGGVYGVRVFGNYDNFPTSKYELSISFNSEPERVKELVETAMEEIKKIQKSGVEEADLQKIKETQRQGRIKGLKENGFWAGQLSSRYRQGLSLDMIKLEEFEKYIDGLNSDALQKAAKQYLKKDNYLELILMPEEQEKR